MLWPSFTLLGVFVIITIIVFVFEDRQIKRGKDYHNDCV